MTRTLSPPRQPTIRRDPDVDAPRLTRGADNALDLAVLVLATWTVVYHLCLLLRLGVPVAAVLEVSALVAGAVWSRRRQRSQIEAEPSTPSPSTAGVGATQATLDASATAVQRSSTTYELALCVVAVASGVATALLVAVEASWPPVAGLWLVSAVAGTGWAALRLRRGPLGAGAGPASAPARTSTTEPVVALVWATALAVFSMITLRPNPDDLFYVNVSQWVVDHGTFPLRDTIFSDLVYPMSSWPPVASYDGLAGAIARLSGVSAGSVVYVVVPPVMTFLSVLALWRLLRAWEIRAVGLALSVSLVFLLFDGGSGYAAPGTLFLTRLWQGKVILLCLMVPLLLVYALRYVQRPSRERAWWLFAGGAAAVGLSTTAMFVVPLLALAGAAPLCRRDPVKALGGFLAMAAYPLGAGALTVAVGGHSADVFESRKLYRFDPAWFGHEILRDGPLAVVVVLAVLAGALLVPHRAARVTTGLLVIITGVTFVPGVTQLSAHLVGLGPTLWRVSWVASISALVGVLVARTAATGNRRLVSLGAAAALVATVVLFGAPIWAARSGVVLAGVPHWQRGPDSLAAAELAVDQLRPGDVILAPDDLAITVTVLTTRVKTVAPRDYFMDYLRDDPSFHYPERLSLVHFANAMTGGGPQVARALTLLDVDEVCLPADSRRRVRFLGAQGYQPAASTDVYGCLTR